MKAKSTISFPYAGPHSEQVTSFNIYYLQGPLFISTVYTVLQLEF